MNCVACCAYLAFGGLAVLAFFMASGVYFSIQPLDANRPFLTEADPSFPTRGKRLYLIGTGNGPYPFEDTSTSVFEQKVWDSAYFLGEFLDATREACQRIYGAETSVNLCEAMYDYDSNLQGAPEDLYKHVFKRTGVLVGVDSLGEAKSLAGSLAKQYQPLRKDLPFRATVMSVNVPVQHHRFSFSMDGLVQAAVVTNAELNLQMVRDRLIPAPRSQNRGHSLTVFAKQVHQWSNDPREAQQMEKIGHSIDVFIFDKMGPAAITTHLQKVQPNEDL